MVNADTIHAKVREIEARVERVRHHCPPDATALVADQDTQDLVAFNLFLAVQAAVDVATHLVADERWAGVDSMAEHFGRLAEHGVLTPETATALARAVGLRNVVAHGYATTDITLLHRAATEGLADLKDFARQVSRWTAARTP